jgi:hypothetical protein
MGFEVAPAWRADENTRKGETLDVDSEEITAYETKGEFKEDYESFCQILGIAPHPQILPLAPPPDPNAEPPSPPPEPKKGKKVKEEAPPPPPVYDMTPVEEVAVKGWEMDIATMTAFNFGIKSSQSILNITFSNAGITAPQIEMLCSALPETPCQVLALDWNEPETPCDECYAMLLGKGSALNHLSLRGNCITDAGAAAIADALTTNCALGSLNLFQNQITDEGGCKIAVALRANSVLTVLSLSKNKLTGVSAKAFGETLTAFTLSVEEMKQRAELELQLVEAKKAAEEAAKKKPKKGAKAAPPPPVVNELPPVKLQDDGTGLGTGNSTLQMMNFSNNDMGDGMGEMATRLAEYLEKGELKTLKDLFLQRNGISEEVAAQFAAFGESMNVRL